MESLLQNLSLPDLWQQQAVRELRNGHDVIVNAPTGAGKTRVFELFADRSWQSRSKQAVFTVPTRALANDKWAEFRELGWKVGIATGDLALDTDASVVIATLETQRERFLHGRGPDLLVVDEYQLLSDEARGLHYELILRLAPSKTQLLLLSGSVGNPERMRDWLSSHDRQVTLVTATERPVPLDDVHMQGLPYQAPKQIKGFWPRLASEVLMADMAPLLIFTPHRKGAEKIARQIADALTTANPLVLSAAQEKAVDKALRKMLTKRVAYHHSGLSYELRAGLIEPLARAGQLSVIVATMGLAAGINFSVRSVFVAESTYHEGPYLHQLQPDELLQMFGRAGRRGKDTVGYAIHGEKNPRLTDARAGDLRRANEIDWPTLLRIMHLACTRNEDPYQAARDFCQGLFSSQPILIGIERVAEAVAPCESKTKNFGLGPSRREILNSAGVWEPHNRRQESESVRLRDVLVRQGTKWRPALKASTYIAQHCRLGRVKRLTQGKFGAEIIIANQKEDSIWRVTKSLAKQLPRRFSEPLVSITEVASEILTLIEPKLNGGQVGSLFEQNGQFIAEVDFCLVGVAAYQDRLGAWLVDPPDRLASLKQKTEVVYETTQAVVEPPKDSPVHAWRSLGLIEADGTPTRRGIIFSYFYHGEGLAVAAALETEDYDLEALVWHLANLRGGHRFATLEGQDSERFTIVCRQTYGPVNYPGYLRLGLPLQYGEGAAEALQTMVSQGKRRIVDSDDLGRGDLERAVHEWLSLLRQVAHAPDLDWNRWQSFKELAQARLQKVELMTKPFTIPTSMLTTEQKQPFPRHRLRTQSRY